MVVGSVNENLILSSRNLAYVNLVSANNMSIYDISNSNILLQVSNFSGGESINFYLFMLSV